MGFLTIAQSASAIGTVGLAVLCGFQLRVFYRQILANRDPPRVQQSRTAHERPHVLVTAESRHAILAENIVSKISAGVLWRISRLSSLYSWRAP